MDVYIQQVFFEGLYSQKIKTLKTSKLKTRTLKSLMEEEIPSGNKSKIEEGWEEENSRIHELKSQKVKNIAWYQHTSNHKIWTVSWDKSITYDRTRGYIVISSHFS